MADTEDTRKRKNMLARARRAADPEKFRAYQREYKRKWGTDNPGLGAAKSRQWRTEHPFRWAYITQKGDAKRRGIPFLLTFEEWLDIWQASGKWEQRGKLAGQYVMARYGDIGPYAVGNVRICTIGDNVREAHKGKIVSAETRIKLSAAMQRNPQPKDKITGDFIRRHGTSTF